MSKSKEDFIKEQTKKYGNHICPMCGSALIRQGGCHKCISCGYEKCDV